MIVSENPTVTMCGKFSLCTRKCIGVSYPNNGLSNYYFYLFIILSGVRLESTWYCGHYWPIVPATDDR
jgi:hypothetical protein